MDAAAFDRFCQSPFWNSTYSWYGNRPDVTPCFQDTVVVCSPCVLLWCVSPFYVYNVIKKRASRLRSSALFRGKLVLSVVALLSALSILGLQIAHHQHNGQSVLKSDVVASLVFSITLIVASVVTVTEHRRGIRASAVLFVFWLLSTLSAAVLFYSAIANEVYSDRTGLFVLVAFRTTSVCSLFVLHCFAEKTSTVSKRQCAEVQSSILSTLTFWWMNRLIVVGHKTPLTEDIVDDLHPAHTAASTVQPFLRHWNSKQQQLGQTSTQPGKKRQRKGTLAATGNRSYTPLDQNGHATELQPLNGQTIGLCLDDNEDDNDDVNVDKDNAADDNDGIRSKRKGKKSNRQTVHVSLLGVLWASFGMEIIVIQLWQLVHDAVMLVTPLIVGLLIDFMENKDGAPVWRGYFLSVLLFLSTLVQAVMDKQVYHQSGCLGLRVRTAVASAVYRKALRLDVSSRQECTVGEMVNLMSVDSQHLEEMTTSLYELWSGPVQLLVSLTLLYTVLGPPLLAGVGLIVIMVPVNIFILGRLRKNEVESMDLRDSRLKILSEVLNGIKIIKMYAWELSFSDKIEKVRQREMSLLFHKALWDTFLHFSWTVAPYIISLAIFITYIYTNEDHYLGPQTVFVTLTYMNVIRSAINTAPPLLSDMISASVSINRLDHFLNQSEFPSDNVCRESCGLAGHREQDNAISIQHASFSWNLDLDLDLDLGRTLKEITLQVPRGSLVAVVGPVGSGKSSLLSAMLGEMHKLSGTVSAKGTIAYVPQQAWILHDTVRDNILFGKTMQQPLYQRCLHACDLHRDLDILPGDDLTEIGEKGVNLSGGQKQRVSLARAIYNDADVYLMDDPLSAVDVHVGMHIFQHVISSTGMLAGKTRVLVTHGVHCLPRVDLVVMMKEGRMVEVGSYDDLLAHNGPLALYLKNCLTTHTDRGDDQSDEEVQEIKHEMLERLQSIPDDDISSTAAATTTTTTTAIITSPTTSQPAPHDSTVSPSSQTSCQPACPVPESEALCVDREGDRPLCVDREGDKPLCVDREGDRGTKEEEEDREERERCRKEKLDKDMADNKHILVEEEELQNKKVKWSVYMEFIRALGVVSSVVIIVLFALYHVALVIGDIFLSQWTDDQRLNNFTLLPVNSTERMDLNQHYLALYGGLGVLQALFMVTFSVLHNRRILAASRSLHQRMLTSVLRAPMMFYETTPQGRIVSRFSKNMDTVESEIVYSSSGTIESTLLVLSSVVVISYSMPWFLVAVVPLFLMYVFVQRFYIPTSRQLTRLWSKSDGPVHSFFNETIMGTSVIRAFQAQPRFVTQFEQRIDENTRFRFYSYCANRWLGFRLDMLGALVVLVTSMAAVVWSDNMSPGLVGLAVTYALSITGNLYFFVTSIGDLETDVVSLERISEMTHIQQEAPWTIASNQPHESWPEAGRVKVSDIDIRYRDGLDLALSGVSFSVSRGEKIGIMGRTGAGKSTLTLALFRLLELAGGKVHIDDLDISGIGLHDLRSRLAVLPQDPVIFAGSIRSNLDPFSEFSDGDVWSALQHAHLKSFVSTLSAGLHYECGERGDNLSVGQRQLVCLARALLHKAQVLVLDEATAAVDMETDDLIQQTLRTQFADCTVLTIAHRLHTVMDYDKILVLDNGQVAAYDSPQRLLQQADNIFYHMAASAGLLNYHQQQQQQQWQQQQEQQQLQQQ